MARQLRMQRHFTARQTQRCYFQFHVRAGALHVAEPEHLDLTSASTLPDAAPGPHKKSQVLRSHFTAGRPWKILVIQRCRTSLCNFLAIALLLRSSPSKGEGKREMNMVDGSQDSRLLQRLK